MTPRTFPPLKTGPLHSVQFVIELVGPRTADRRAVLRLLDPDWSGALGHPSVWAMALSDESWQPLLGHPAASFDSVCLCWDLIGPKGRLSAEAATRLLARCEEFASAIQRRALPHWPAEEVTRRADELATLREYLDAGLSVEVAFTPPQNGVSVAQGLQNLGMAAEGLDAYVIPTIAPRPPLLGAYAWSGTAPFSPNQSIEGLTIGYHLARSADPSFSLRELKRVGLGLAGMFAARVTDDEGSPVDWTSLDKVVEQYVENMRAARLEPGGAELLRLFPED